MAAVPYSRAALRRYREEREARGGPERPASLLAEVPPDAPMDDGLVVGVWNGERFVAWEKWLATAPVVVEPNGAKPALPRNAEGVTAECGGTRIWLVRDGDRWLMFAGTRKNRRKDFASPFLEHAQRTAEAWYGPAQEGWHAER